MTEQKFADKYQKSEPAAGGSMADKYKKSSSGSAFTGESLEKKKVERKSSAAQAANIDPQKKSKADLIYLVKGVDAGSNAWYYVLVDRLKLQLFLKALDDDIIHLENFGVILFSAYGDEPPVEVTNKLKAEYGIEG